MTRSRRSLYAALLSALVGPAPAWAACEPGWRENPLIDGESLANWTAEGDDPAGPGTLRLEPGLEGQAVRFDWAIGPGGWAQAKYAFPAPVDLSGADLIGLSLRGGGAGETPHDVRIMFADQDGVFYGYVLGAGVNRVDRWLSNHSVPRRMFQYLWGGPTPGAPIDWSRIDRFFVTVLRPAGAADGGAGRLSVDRVQSARAAGWPRQAAFEGVTGGAGAAGRALSYVRGQQRPTGLITSWKEEPDPKAWLYDQSLALMALTRDGAWRRSSPANASARAAAKLANFLAAAQKADGHWARAWNPSSGAELQDDGWIGDQAWCVTALAVYAGKASAGAARAAVQRGADWLAARIDPSGMASDSTEGTVDAWWAMTAAGRPAEADRIKAYLLDTAWDRDMQYWWGGRANPFIAMDAAGTWTAAFARHPSVNRPDMALAALTFAGKTLSTQSDDGAACGLDGVGPVSLWNEGMGQYVSAGGEGAQSLLATLLSQQRADGAMPGSPDNWSTPFGWLSSWSGLAPTCWLYFAVTGRPFLDVPGGAAAAAAAAPASLQVNDAYAYPNPVRAGNRVVFHVEADNAEGLALKVYDVAGRLVHGEEVTAAPSMVDGAGGPRYAYEFPWTTAGATPGVYLCIFDARGAGSSTRRAAKLAIVR